MAEAELICDTDQLYIMVTACVVAMIARQQHCYRSSFNSCSTNPQPFNINPSSMLQPFSIDPSSCCSLFTIACKAAAIHCALCDPQAGRRRL